MDCASCNQSLQGCASIKCSKCTSQFHLECIDSKELIASTNSWQCDKCSTVQDAIPHVIESVRA